MNSLQEKIEKCLRTKRKILDLKIQIARMEEEIRAECPHNWENHKTWRICKDCGEVEQL